MNRALIAAGVVTLGVIGYCLVSRKYRSLNFKCTPTEEEWWTVNQGTWVHTWVDSKTNNLYRRTDRGTEVYHDGKWERSCFQ